MNTNYEQPIGFFVCLFSHGTTTNLKTNNNNNTSTSPTVRLWSLPPWTPQSSRGLTVVPPRSEHTSPAAGRWPSCVGRARRSPRPGSQNKSLSFKSQLEPRRDLVGRFSSSIQSQRPLAALRPLAAPRPSSSMAVAFSLTHIFFLCLPPISTKSQKWDTFYEYEY